MQVPRLTPAPDVSFATRRVNQETVKSATESVIAIPVVNVGAGAAESPLSVLAGQVIRVDRAVAYNQGATARNLDVQIHATAGTPTVGDRVGLFSVGAGATLSIAELEGIVIPSEHTLRLLVSGDTINVFLSVTLILGGT